MKRACKTCPNVIFEQGEGYVRYICKLNQRSMNNLYSTRGYYKDDAEKDRDRAWLEANWYKMAYPRWCPLIKHRKNSKEKEG